MTKEQLLDALKNDCVNVTFTKKDGTIREMICTLLDSVVPKVDSTREKPEDLITVWDVEKEGWRSFYLDSIIDVSTYNV